MGREPGNDPPPRTAPPAGGSPETPSFHVVVSPSAAVPEDARMEAYKAVRAHELMLNEATSKFEHATLAPLVVLNGGALVAFLTLLGALLGKDSGRRPDLWLAAPAVGVWCIGLIGAALAVRGASAQQRAISTAQRMMREALEDDLYAPDIAAILSGPLPSRKEPKPSDDLPQATGPGPGPPTGGDAPKGLFDRGLSREERQRERKQIRKHLHGVANGRSNRSTRAWWGSVLAFVLGAALALASVLVGANVRSGSATPKAPAKAGAAAVAPRDIAVHVRTVAPRSRR